ncbi:uncharacterized protein KGF55_001068 [Candida pseudojiufengensis]|uniref:uncharacterized protein n=1 Tax=Candida pseudojiufengensis TaxID=497109 RepID=UPI0022245B6E|nr:uncharacterized protein KGF55_001068 [Candida pseudojiufengensis]KAI5965706.1 hypothetical protein KGF55_001068 [Candida pseudojiufengensis]
MVTDSYGFYWRISRKNGCDFILAVVDRFTKRAHFIPTSKSITAQGCTQLFVKEIFRLHGLPDEIIHDNDVRFATHFWQDFFRELKVELHFTSVYHPQSDGQTKRTNRTLIPLLRAFVKKIDQNLLLKLHIVE